MECAARRGIAERCGAIGRSLLRHAFLVPAFALGCAGGDGASSGGNGGGSSVAVGGAPGSGGSGGAAGSGDGGSSSAGGSTGVGGDAGTGGSSASSGGAGGSAGSGSQGTGGIGGAGGAGGSLGTGGAGGSRNDGGAGHTCVKANIKDCLLPAVKGGGFAMADQIVWCSSIIKIGDVYHMFASRWPAQYGLAGWTMYSEAVRATSSSLFGPYTFQEVVLQKRTDNWDNTRIHNVRIVKAGSKFVLFYIDTANETGYAVADAVTGPWTRQDKSAMKVSNPAPFVRPDLSLYVFGRLGDSSMVNRGIAFTAPTYQGPYTVVKNGDNLLPNDYELEDPTIWWANDQYNVVATDWKGKVTGTVKDGVQYASKDGITYKLTSPDSVFTKTIEYDDGSTETCSRRERPFVYSENGEALALFTACLPASGPAHVVVQPADHYVPAN
jgi:hypothetical protein